MEYDPLYDAEKGFTVMPSSFHDIGDVEFQDNWGRVWYEFKNSTAYLFSHSIQLKKSDYRTIHILLQG